MSSAARKKHSGIEPGNKRRDSCGGIDHSAHFEHSAEGASRNGRVVAESCNDIGEPNQQNSEGEHRNGGRHSSGDGGRDGPRHPVAQRERKGAKRAHDSKRNDAQRPLALQPRTPQPSRTLVHARSPVEKQPVETRKSSNLRKCTQHPRKEHEC
eukprot:Amastigsp_a346541_10.p3 type:complete len:154 gc:universal Amastigsp_a346541_10:172-633(+)